MVVTRILANGVLDTSFDGDGKVTTPIGDQSGFEAVAVQADQKIVAAGFTASPTMKFAVVRYNANGSLDTSFDGDGKAITEMLPARHEAMSIAIQGDGKIVVGGKGYDAAGQGYFLLARYNTSGALDASFNGDGKVIHYIGGSPDGKWAGVNTIVLQPDGKIVAAGRGGFLARYNSDGSVDASFGAAGVAWHAPMSSFIHSVSLQSDGKILLSGGAAYQVSQFNSDGSLDTTFAGGAGTIAILPTGNSFALEVQADGKIAVTGNHNGDVTTARLNGDGTLDAAWHGGASPSASALASTEITVAPAPPVTGGLISALDAAAVQQLLAEAEAKNTWIRKSRFELLAL
jgi:uncharacterized delta-60 repeat protein